MRPEMAQPRPPIRESPANADVAQLVEHFTRNEGVPGSSPGVGSKETGLWTEVVATLVATGGVVSVATRSIERHSSPAW